MSKDNKNDETGINSPKFEFAMKAAFQDPEFVDSLKKKWEELLSDGRALEHAHHALSLWTINTVSERMRDEP